MQEQVNHPEHYQNRAEPLEPIDVLRFAPFDLGNALKYLICAGHKGDRLTDLRKAKWYIQTARETFQMLDAPYQDFWQCQRYFVRKFTAISSKESEPYGVLLKSWCVEDFMKGIEDLLDDEIKREQGAPKVTRLSDVPRAFCIDNIVVKYQDGTELRI